MPPITVTMKDSISTEKPMPETSERTGTASAPGKAGKQAAQREDGA